MISSNELRQKFLDFFKSKGHVIVPSSSLVPENDPSVLLTTAGMQQFKPYYTGAADPLRDNHLSLGKPLGNKNVASVQKSFRTSDIDEVGDDTHLTFFEMLGNFSFGGYKKKEAIEYAYEFITKVLGLEIDYVSVFKGEGRVPPDTESEKIWRQVDPKLTIKKAGRKDNFWGPTGDQGPCGPTTEIYVNPSADSAGPSVEVWNIVFNEYFQQPDKTLTKLDNLGVDTGMGLERLAVVMQKVSNIYETDLFAPIMKSLPADLSDKEKRIIADHIRASVFLLADGVRPSNKESGYILRRLIRRMMTYLNKVDLKIDSKAIKHIAQTVREDYHQYYPELDSDLIYDEISLEVRKFRATIEHGLKIIEGKTSITSKEAFDLYQSHGFPLELIKELVRVVDENEFQKEFAKHQELSKTASAGMFKGGLVDQEPQTIKHHTAHHLLLAALRQVLGNHVLQRGSNVSSERLRIDFSHHEKMTPEQSQQVEEIVNKAIQDDLEVKRDEMPKVEAEKLGALAEFGAKYSDTVTVYTILNKDGSVFSREFCGGPHVGHTGEIGNFKIIKEEAVAAGIRRIKAVAGK